MESSFSADLTCMPDEEDALREYIGRQREWFHQFVFSNGLTTPGRDPSHKKLHHLCLPASLKGKSVIDIGAYEGFFSFHCEARGADRVVAADRFVWDWPGSSALPNFRAVHRALASRVEVLSANVEDLPATANETFDISLFLGVLYHAPNMMQYLDAVSSLTKGVLVLETFADALDESGARAVLYAERELNNDSSNWFGPNLPAIEVMLSRVGFKHIELVNLWSFNTRDQLEGRSAFGPIRSGRVVIHAYK
jgi:tRNA (mo5U34)-methyltransferase